MFKRTSKIVGLAIILSLAFAAAVTAQEKTDKVSVPSQTVNSNGEGESANDVAEPAYAGSLLPGATPKITPNQAQRAALEANPGFVAVSVQLEDENGQVVYAVLLNSGLVVKVDAGNGKILWVEAQAEEHKGMDAQFETGAEQGKESQDEGNEETGQSD